VENLGCAKGKTRKNKMLQKSTSRTLAKTPLNPVEIQYSCGFGAYHLSKNRAYVLNLATVHFRFLAHLLANARSLGLRRAEPPLAWFAGFRYLVWRCGSGSETPRKRTPNPRSEARTGQNSKLSHPKSQLNGTNPYANKFPDIYSLDNEISTI